MFIFIELITFWVTSITLSKLSLLKLHLSKAKLRISGNVLTQRYWISLCCWIFYIVCYLYFHLKSDENILNWIKRHYVFVIPNTTPAMLKKTQKLSLTKYCCNCTTFDTYGAEHWKIDRMELLQRRSSTRFFLHDVQ